MTIDDDDLNVVQDDEDGLSQPFNIPNHPRSATMTEPTNVPPGFIPIFNFENQLSRSITLALELNPLEIVLAPGDAVQVFVYEDDITLPMSMVLSDDYLQIHPHRSWGNWYAYKNGEDVSGEPYRTPL